MRSCVWSGLNTIKSSQGSLSFKIKYFLRYQVLGFLRCFLLLNFYSKFFIFINFVANFIQESSYYKMLRHIFEPQMCPAQNTGYRGPIFCSISCMGLPTGAIEAIFEFRPWGRDMGYPLGASGGQKWGKFFFQFWQFFLWKWLLWGVFQLKWAKPTLFCQYNHTLEKLQREGSKASDEEPR